MLHSDGGRRTNEERMHEEDIRRVTLKMWKALGLSGLLTG